MAHYYTNTATKKRPVRVAVGSAANQTVVFNNKMAFANSKKHHNSGLNMPPESTFAIFRTWTAKIKFPAYRGGHG